MLVIENGKQRITDLKLPIEKDVNLFTEFARTKLRKAGESSMKNDNDNNNEKLE